MKRRNFNKSILQRGGLMIEALAMLGLIAVVTPTMYKKSAERTMEVEDINTAATIRTITAAANDYVSANYSTILGDMIKNNEHNRRLNIDDLEAYLPYGFDISHALYNYDGANIQLSVSRPEGSNNLTTLMLFPARMNENDGIGQERTSRIAALIGSNGGYVTDTNKARGIGGIWELSGEDYTKNFNSANKYSIVTASADTISASAGNEMDYTKYLQRGKDAGDDEGQWKNTMRTDLYMGGPDTSTEDVYHAATGPWSIRNIKSLIVGANTSGGVDGEGNDLADAGGYGLYVAPGATNPNAYIHGSLIAAGQLFKADTDSLSFGRYTIADNGNAAYHFNVDTAGNTRADGSLTNLMDVNLASKLNDDGTGPAWSEVKIGARKKIRGNIIRYLIRGNANTVGDRPGQLYIMDGGYDLIVDSDGDHIRPHQTEYRNKEISQMFPVKIGANTKVDGLLSANMIDTQKLRIATLEAGSGYIDDANKWLRADKYGVLIQQIDLDNPNISHVPNSTRVNFENNKITLGIGTDGTDTKRSAGLVLQNEIKTKDDSTKESIGTATLTANKDIYVEAKNDVNITGENNVNITGKNNLAASGKTTLIQASKNNLNDTKDNGADLAENTLLLRNDDMQMKMQDKETVIGPRTIVDNDGVNTASSPETTRTLFDKGNLDLADTNFNIARTTRDTNGKITKLTPIFSASNDNSNKRKKESGFDINFNNKFIDDYSTVKDETGYVGNYDLALHGNVLITNLQGGKYAAGDENTDVFENISIGKLNKKAGINIVNGPTIASSLQVSYYHRSFNTKSTAEKNIIYIDQGAESSKRDINTKSANQLLLLTKGKETNNNNYMNVDPGTIYIRKGYVEVHGEKDIPSAKTPSTKNAYEGNGVLVASRLVANNPTNGADGATVPQLVTTAELQNYETKGEDVKRYDTYMVNPAYTSVMHDIKLTTRGGARLSDILPDFINKGIYVVNNTFLEVKDDDLEFKTWPTTYNTKEIIIDNKTYSAIGKSIDFGKSWASPFMGVVPAPQCPPGYGRVITLTPASFETGISGSLQTDNQGKYYVLPEKVQDEQYALTVKGQRPKYETVAIESASGSMNVSINNSALNLSNAKANVSELSGISTAKYVLASNELKKSDGKTLVAPITPLTVQQSTWLKSGVQKLTSDGTDTGYAQGWATTMGFLYKNALYMPLLDSDAKSNKFSWNVFPVMPYTLEGYATVYCYFDRTNLYGGRGGENYESYIDKLNYMSNPKNKQPSGYKKDAGDNYKARLNDPNMKYDEVW